MATSSLGTVGTLVINVTSSLRGLLGIILGTVCSILNGVIGGLLGGILPGLNCTLVNNLITQLTTVLLGPYTKLQTDLTQSNNGNITSDCNQLVAVLYCVITQLLLLATDRTLRTNPCICGVLAPIVNQVLALVNALLLLLFGPTGVSVAGQQCRTNLYATQLQLRSFFNCCPNNTINICNIILDIPLPTTAPATTATTTLTSTPTPTTTSALTPTPTTITPRCITTITASITTATPKRCKITCSKESNNSTNCNVKCCTQDLCSNYECSSCYDENGVCIPDKIILESQCRDVCCINCDSCFNPTEEFD